MGVGVDAVLHAQPLPRARGSLVGGVTVSDYISGDETNDEWLQRDDPPAPSDFHEVGYGFVKRFTERAMLVRLRGAKEDKWVPLSVLAASSELNAASDPGDGGKLVVQEWFAIKVGWAKP